MALLVNDLRGAVDRGDIDIVHALLAAGATVNPPAEYGRTPPLLLAVQSCVPQLWDSGTVTATGGFQRVWERRLAVVTALVRAGADPNACSYTGITPLFISAQHPTADCMTMLLDSGAAVPRDPDAVGALVGQALSFSTAAALRALFRAGVARAENDAVLRGAAASYAHHFDLVAPMSTFSCCVRMDDKLDEMLRWGVTVEPREWPARADLSLPRRREACVRALLAWNEGAPAMDRWPADVAELVADHIRLRRLPARP